MRTLPYFNGFCNSHEVRALLTVPDLTLPTTPPFPEAPCSVNGYFHLAGFSDRFQATGRGTSPQEAAANLRGTIAATQAALETPVVLSREERLSALLDCGLLRAAHKGDYGLCERLKKGAALVTAGAVSPGERDGMLAVQSQSTPAHWYEVDGHACSCPDWEFHARQGKHQHCKHVLATMLYARLAEVTP
jgi:hypothetical protein